MARIRSYGYYALSTNKYGRGSLYPTEGPWYGGHGWRAGLQFQVTMVTKFREGRIYFGGRSGHGVFSHAIKDEILEWDKDNNENM